MINNELRRPKNEVKSVLNLKIYKKRSKKEKEKIISVCNSGYTPPQDFWEWFCSIGSEVYPSDFHSWFLQYRYNPFPDSAETSFREWKKLSEEDKKICLSVVEIYVSLHENPKHNPRNYLKEKIFLESKYHTPNAENVSYIKVSDATQTRFQADLERKFGTSKYKNDPLRNKAEVYEV